VVTSSIEIQSIRHQQTMKVALKGQYCIVASPFADVQYNSHMLSVLYRKGSGESWHLQEFEVGSQQSVYSGHQEHERSATHSRQQPQSSHTHTHTYIPVLAVLCASGTEKNEPEGPQQFVFPNLTSERQIGMDMAPRHHERSMTCDRLPPQSPYVYPSCALRFL